MNISRPVLWTAGILLVAGFLPFVWKTLVLDLPVVPSRASKVWQVELRVLLRGQEGPGSVTLRLPTTDASQVILDEQVERDSLDYRVRDDGDDRLALWRGRIGDLSEVAYMFRVHLRQSLSSIPDAIRTPRSVEDGAVGARLLEQLTRLHVDPGEDLDSAIRTVFAFVAHEVETAEGASDDAELTLASREGSRLGKARLLAGLLHAADVDAVLVQGVNPRGPSYRRLVHFVEARGEQGWIPLDPARGSVAAFPDELIVLARGDRPLVSVTGAGQWSLQTRVVHEPLEPEEIVSFMTPPGAFWRWASLYRLPLGAQSNLRVLLLLPLAVLVTAVFRNLIGLRTFGTFMPVLVAVSLREIDLPTGLALVASILGAGTAARLLLDRLRLLFVPRVCLLLCMVVLSVTALALVGHSLGGRDLMTGILFPIVILALLIERIAVTSIEEGSRVALELMLNSFIVAAVAYPIFRFDYFSHLFFGFPELILCTMAFLVVIGGYTGYRISELIRFRALAEPRP